MEVHLEGPREDLEDLVDHTEDHHLEAHHLEDPNGGPLYGPPSPPGPPDIPGNPSSLRGPIGGPPYPPTTFTNAPPEDGTLDQFGCPQGTKTFPR